MPEDPKKQRKTPAVPEPEGAPQAGEEIEEKPASDEGEAAGETGAQDESTAAVSTPNSGVPATGAGSGSGVRNPYTFSRRKPRR